MGGQPLIIVLRATIVAIMLAALPSGAAFAQQFHAPESLFKPKVVKKARRYFRPTMPLRNPERPAFAARILAYATPSAKSAPGAEASSAAGIGSTASGHVAAVVPESAPDDPAETPMATASLPSGTETAVASAETTGDATNEDAAPPAVSAETDTATASGLEESEKADDATETAGDTADEAAEQPAELTEVASSEEAAADAKAEQAEEVEQVAEAAEPAEAESPAETAGMTPAEPEPASEPNAVEPPAVKPPDEATEIAGAPAQDATVVIDVSPPPEEAASDAEPIEIAAVTPPSEPVPAPIVPAEIDEPAPAETEPTPAAEEITDNPPSDGEPEMPPSAESASETPAPEAAGGVPEIAEDVPEIVETVPEVVLPPADPVVAAIRARLADPEYRKGVRPATLKALETFYEPHELAPLWITDDGFSANARALIGEIGKAGEWGLDARAFDVPDADASPATAESQAAAELKLDMAILKYARVAQGGRLSPQRVSKLFDQHPKLTDPKTVLADLAAAGAPTDYLLSLHPQHQQYKRLRSALAKARAANNTADIQRIVINMERWRWMPRQLGSYYVLNNVPEFNTRVVKNGKTVYTEKTIVGQLKYATPFFSASMRTIVFHPDWTVPPTIIKEDLAPKLQKRRGIFSESYTRILTRYGLSVKYKGEPIDADKVDWVNEDIHKYTFVQAPGPANVLGKFKFNFPNKHAIYMHDTPQPELFNKTVRTLSHGCIRVRDPDRLVALLLAEDRGWRPAQIKNLIARGEHKVIPLRRPVPVHLTYFTATVGDDGRLQIFSDIYGLDNRMAPKLFDKPVQFQVPAEPVIADAGSRSRDRGRSGRRNGGGFGNLITGLFGN